MEKHILAEYTLPKHDYGEIMSHVSSRNVTCSHYHTSRKIPGKLQETILSQPFFPTIMGAGDWGEIDAMFFLACP